MTKSSINTLKAWIYSQPTLQNVPNYNGQQTNAKQLFKPKYKDAA
jgi:hypothetical protein